MIKVTRIRIVRLNCNIDFLDDNRELIEPTNVTCNIEGMICYDITVQDKRKCISEYLIENCKFDINYKEFNTFNYVTIYGKAIECLHNHICTNHTDLFLSAVQNNIIKGKKGMIK